MMMALCLFYFRFGTKSQEMIKCFVQHGFGNLNAKRGNQKKNAA
jgi:hypothetical protein